MGFDRISGLPARGKVTFDLLDSESNSRAQRYCSRFPEPVAESVDALSVPVNPRKALARSHLSR